MAEHGKKYKDAGEEMRRYAFFKDTLRRMDQYKAVLGRKSVIFVYNGPFSDLSHEEWGAMGTHRDAGHNEKRGGLPHVGDYLHKPLVHASFLVAPSFPRLPPHRRRWISRPFGRLISAESRHRCRGWGSRRSWRRRRVASASQNAPSNPPHLRAQKVLDDLPAMDSDDEMVALLLEDEQAFDDDVREHLLIIASLQDMLDAEAEKRKRPRRGGSRPGRRKSKPRQRMEGHAMLHNDYFADDATQADNFRRRTTVQYAECSH
ncbi:uncharacterized protein [Lolium perenne]|uniref:uncharacterized protein n=1 Tax=Lolium perenne TaxID=4522 RepID=UPI003A997071